MTCQPELTDAEWELMLQLIEEQRRELPSEIHHTDHAGVREALHQRQKMRNQLIERIRAGAAAAV